MKVSVLTASLSERSEMLDEARACVAAQTHPDVEHLIGVDEFRMGAGPVLNRLLLQSSGDWVMVLDDDDLLAPNHIETLIAEAESADVIYSLPEVTGGRFTQYDVTFDRELLARGFNCVSHTALMRAELVRKIGGWSNVRGFDLDLFQRLSGVGARFAQVPLVTWTYRLHGSNWSQGTLAGAAS